MPSDLAKEDQRLLDAYNLVTVLDHPLEYTVQVGDGALGMS